MDATDIVILTEIRKIINESSPKHYAIKLKKKKWLIEWMKDQTSKYGDNISIPEMVYLVLNPNTQPICANNQRKKFNTIKKGYRQYCGSKDKCVCNAEGQSERLKEYHNARSDEETQDTISKMRQTMIERYGVDNAVHIDGVLDKMKETNRERYGVDWAPQSKEVQKKINETNKERYGCHPTQTKKVKEKIRLTALENHNVTDQMELARNAYRDNTGYDNPFANPEVMNAIKLTNLKRYGVEHPLQSAEIRQRRLTTYRSRYNRDNYSQVHISNDALTTLNNKVLLSSLLDRCNMQQASNLLGINAKTLARYMIKHGIELPGRSSYENQMKQFLTNHDIIFKQNTHKVINGELDFYISSHNLAIEICGLYYHSQYSERGKSDRYYHYNKWKQCIDKDIQLITIFEDELVYTSDIVYSRLAHMLGVNNAKTIGARKIAIINIDWITGKNFLNEHHIQGGEPNTKYRYGAFYGEKMVAVMLFSDNTMGDYDCELVRFATDGGNYPGLVSKMMKHFTRLHPRDTIVSFSDNRWSDGNIYGVLGFVNDGAVLPTYYYTNYKERFVKTKFRKDKILKAGYDPVKYGRKVDDWTESEAMRDLGYDRIYDCGKIRWVYYRK